MAVLAPEVMQTETVFPMTKDEKVFAVIQKYDCLPFRFGDDCCQFAGDVIEAITGSNPMDRFSYSSEAEANDIISSFGGLKSAITNTLGEPDGLLQSGDIALVKFLGIVGAGVVYKDRLVVRTQRGVMDYPLDRAVCSWGVD